MATHQLRGFSTPVAKIDYSEKRVSHRKAKPKEVKQVKQKTTVLPILDEEHRTGYKVCPTAQNRHAIKTEKRYEVDDIRPIHQGHYVDDLGLIHVYRQQFNTPINLKPNYKIEGVIPANGQYTRLSATCRQFKYIIDRYQPTIIFKQSLIDATVPLEAIWIKRSNGWEPTRILTTEEYSAFVSFAGSYVIDIDELIRNKSKKIKVEGKRTNPTRFTGKKIELEKYEDGVKSQNNSKGRKHLIKAVQSV